MEYGKFSSAEELLKGYTELEKSFTQKCQELSALERKYNESGTNGEPSPQQNVGQSVANDTVDTVPEAKDADSVEPISQPAAELTPDAVRQYLVEHPEIVSELSTHADSLSDTNQRVAPPRVMTVGGNVSCALPNRPKTLKEASELAKKLL